MSMPRPKPEPLVNQIANLLRETGPLTVDLIAALLVERGVLISKNPKSSVRNAIQNSRSELTPVGDGRYCYLPAVVEGATVRLPMDLIAPETQQAAAAIEALALLWLAGRSGAEQRNITLQLENGPLVAIASERMYLSERLRWPLRLPAPFWDWWTEQQAHGADTVVLHYEDAAQGRFAVRAVEAATLDPAAVQQRNAELRAAAIAVLKGGRGTNVTHFVQRLLGRGVYHGDPPPEPLSQTLLVPHGPFVAERSEIVYRPDLRPAWLKVFGERLQEEQELSADTLRVVMGLPGAHFSDDDEEEEEEVEEDNAPPGLLGLPPHLLSGPGAVRKGWDNQAANLPPPPEATSGYRLKVSLAGSRGVWRVIEMLDNQTFDDLHDAIQEAFNWDNDHLYAFFLSGQPWDSLTELASPDTDTSCPHATEVFLGELELEPKQKFLYIFDFGDQLNHTIEVQRVFPVPAAGEFPRIVESHGAAPPQYPVWDEDDGGEEDEEEGDEEA